MSNVLITGCSSGFGHLTALDLARRGERVFATMRNPTEAPDLTRTAERENLPLSVHQIDVRHTSSIDLALAEISRLTASIDVLVNNAGLSLQGPIEALADDELHDQLDTNVVGLVRMVRAVAPLMRAQGAGTIINISSLAGLVGIPFEGAYAASKHAVEAISESLRFELAPFGVHVLLIEPGAYDTAFTGNARQARGLTPDSPYRPSYDEFWTAIDATLHAAGRGDPADVVEAIRTAIAHPDGPFRRRVGADAELIYGLKTQKPYEEFERSIRTTLGLTEASDPAAASVR